MESIVFTLYQYLANVVIFRYLRGVFIRCVRVNNQFNKMFETDLQIWIWYSIFYYSNRDRIFETIFDCSNIKKIIRKEFGLFEYQKNYSKRIWIVRISKKIFETKKIIRNEIIRNELFETLCTRSPTRHKEKGSTKYFTN